jgi:hypothetical protein
MCWVGLLQQVLMLLLLQLCNRQEMEYCTAAGAHSAAAAALPVPFERSDRRCFPVIDFSITAP